MTDCDVCQILTTPSDDELKMRIIEGESWVATLRQTDQEYLGTTFVTARRHVSSLPELTDLEEREFIIIRNKLIQAQTQAFGAQVVNVSCLMNETFRSIHPTPHVHYHFKPRYATPVTIGGEIFEDSQFGNYIREKKPRPVSLEMGIQIVNSLKQHL